ncbi:MAG: hypothetical protein OHK0032_14450 [Thermodesulfovibrionales bacterium]
MRYAILTLALLVLLLTGTAYAAHDDATPYGDYCMWCGAYGICKENLEPKEAENAIERYFAIKGFRATNMQHKGRFIEAEIYRDNRLVDKIIFDRKTGRIRSTY